MFFKGGLYLLEDIYNQLGGLKRGLLPHQDGRIVCARLRPENQPLAPDTVFAWVGKNRTRGNQKSNDYWAREYYKQQCSVPIFIAFNSYQWKYVGNYYVERITEDPKEISKYQKKYSSADRELAVVLFLKEGTPGQE